MQNYSWEEIMMGQRKHRGPALAGSLLLVTIVAVALFATPSMAQDRGDSESPFRSFDDITVERITPDELPNFRSDLPTGPSRLNISDLPRNMSSDEMRRVNAIAQAATIEIVAVQTPPRPYRQTPMLYHGHALWISPERSGEDPILVATADWLQDAEAIYALDSTSGQALLSRGLRQAGDLPRITDSYPLGDFIVNRGDFIEEYEDHLIALTVERLDRHVNLVELSSVDIVAPETGLIIHDMDVAMPSAIFGYSPTAAATVVPVGYDVGASIHDEFSFYFLTTFQAILGAPIVGSNGHLIGITALRYPPAPEKTLTIPPGAIHYFLDTGRAGVEDDDD